jgi:hypothetical protein
MERASDNKGVTEPSPADTLLTARFIDDATLGSASTAITLQPSRATANGKNVAPDPRSTAWSKDRLERLLPWD